MTKVAHMIIVLNPNARTDLVRPEQNRNHLLKAKYTLAKQIILSKLCANWQETTFLKKVLHIHWYILEGRTGRANTLYRDLQKSFAAAMAAFFKIKPASPKYSSAQSVQLFSESA